MAVSAVGWNIWESPWLLFFIPLVVVMWAAEMYVGQGTSSWSLLAAAIWLALQYGRKRRREELNELNARWRQRTLLGQPATAKEPTEWLNKLLVTLWPNCLEPHAVHRMLLQLQRLLKEHKPGFIRSIEVKDFSLGSTAPEVGLGDTFWSTQDSGLEVLRTGIRWDTSELNVVFAVNLNPPVLGQTATVVVTSVFLRGNLLLYPVLEGRGVLYSFDGPPDVSISLGFAPGSSSVPFELPGLSSWLEKMALEALGRTAIEPRRRLWSLAEPGGQQPIGGVLCVRPVEGKQLARSKPRDAAATKGRGPPAVVGSTFLEISYEDLRRRTQVSGARGGNPTWGDALNLLLHDSRAALHVSVYEQPQGVAKCEFLGSCEIKVAHVGHEGAVYWAVGRSLGVVAARSQHCRQPAILTVPLEGSAAGEIVVELSMSEWFFDAAASRSSVLRSASTVHTQQLSPMPPVQPPSGRRIRVTVAEGRNLGSPDGYGQSDPFVRLQYGKSVRRTRGGGDPNPTWAEVFEFRELAGGGQLRLICGDAGPWGASILGSARINLYGLQEGSVQSVWVPLEKALMGDVLLKLEIVPADTAADKGTGGGPPPSTPNGDWGGTQHPILEIVLIEARGLVSEDSVGVTNPYVSVSYGSSKLRSGVVYRSTSPRWHDALIVRDDGSPLELVVMDHNAIMPPSNIGSCRVEYSSLPLSKSDERWIPLQGVAGGGGEIHVRVTRKLQALDKESATASLQRLGSRAPANFRVQTSTHKAKSLIRQALAWFVQDDGDLNDLHVLLEDLEGVEDEREKSILRIQQDRDLLVAKVKELERVMREVL